jgi:hypothetical protein
MLSQHPGEHVYLQNQSTRSSICGENKHSGLWKDDSDKGAKATIVFGNLESNVIVLRLHRSGNIRLRRG